MKTKIIKMQNWKRLILCQEKYCTDDMKQMLENVETLFFRPNKVFKKDKTSTVIMVKHHGKQFVIKKANTKNWVHVIRRIFQTSRAKKNFQNSYKLRCSDVSTFESIAIIENRFGPLKGENYLVMSYLIGQDALTYYQANDQSQWEEISQKIVTLLCRLHQKKMIHNDVNLSNIIFVQAEPFLIDLDGLRVTSSSLKAKFAHKREITRFLQNCRDVGLPVGAQKILKKLL